MSERPFFYHPQAVKTAEIVALPEETARHIGQVLRMAAGDELILADGLGHMAACRITESGKKRVTVTVDAIESVPAPGVSLQLAIAFTRNTARNEWILEKATELGVQRITPLITARSSKERIRPERWTAILVSAMLQSRQAWLPVLDAPAALGPVLAMPAQQRLIAHCMDDSARLGISKALKPGLDTQMLIGPEGDFDRDEVTLANAAGAHAISLGPNRLRTETAAIAAVTQFYFANYAS
jgi:16S rRNA (uracil1498-N3)-methyltransferase